VRRTEAAAQSDEVLLIRPGSDAALALAVMHVIITEKLYDPTFVEAHTAGFEELSTHVLPFTPAWGAEETGLEASQITSFARAFASTRPAMILLGGSSMHKGANGWHAARAISCLPLYLMERALEREGETRPIYEILRSLANSLGLADFFPWAASTEEVLDTLPPALVARADEVIE
jgi:predicted molibdopterin-dependent oxidoreductase YjgC